MKSAKLGEVSKVILDNLVLMKILKHSKAADYKSANGQLLGLYDEKNYILEITNSYPLPLKEGADQTQGEDSYDADFTNRLESVNLDNNKVGWYQVSYTNDHLSFISFDQQLDYQVFLKNLYLKKILLLWIESSSFCSFFGV